MKICVYCSASSSLESVFLEAGEAFGRSMAARGHSLVYGGYNQGVMGAVADGVAAMGGEIIAAVPAIFDREDFTHSACSRVIRTGSMSERKAAMEREADAFVVLPGGIGTLDEFFEVFVLRVLGQLNKPVAVLNVDGCYDPLRELLKAFVQRRFMKQEDLNRVHFYTQPEALLGDLEAAKQE